MVAGSRHRVARAQAGIKSDYMIDRRAIRIAAGLLCESFFQLAFKRTLAPELVLAESEFARMLFKV